MAEREIVWTRNAEIHLQAILEFYTARNKSNKYSRKLYREIKSELKTVSRKPKIGIKTKIENVRGLIFRDYIVFYEMLADKIMVLKVWDSRQDPQKLNISR
jgi:plasmid stabilization system protein ParE